jgi:hypothetical protein
MQVCVSAVRGYLPLKLYSNDRRLRRTQHLRPPLNKKQSPDPREWVTNDQITYAHNSQFSKSRSIMGVRRRRRKLLNVSKRVSRDLLKYSRTGRDPHLAFRLILYAIQPVHYPILDVPVRHGYFNSTAK